MAVIVLCHEVFPHHRSTCIKQYIIAIIEPAVIFAINHDRDLREVIGIKVLVNNGEHAATIMEQPDILWVDRANVNTHGLKVSTINHIHSS